MTIIAVIGLGQMGASYARHATMMADQVICYDYDAGQRANFSDRLLNDNNPFDIFNNDEINSQKIQIVNDIA